MKMKEVFDYWNNDPMEMIHFVQLWIERRRRGQDKGLKKEIELYWTLAKE